jgi:hypothetical protein
MFPLGFGKVKIPRRREFAVLKAADILAAVVEVAYGSFHSVAAMSLEHSRMRFAETRDILMRIATEIETTIRPSQIRET